jgi:hypothetical protein
MKILITMVSDGASLLPLDTIEYEGGLWLVPLWIATQDGERLQPARIIRLDSLPHTKLGPPQPFDFQLLSPIPKGVLDGTASPLVMQRYDVIESPAIQRPKGSVH